MAEEENPQDGPQEGTQDGPKTVLANDLKIGDVIIDTRGRNLEVIGIDTSGKWANVMFRAPDGLEFENSYSKDKQLSTVPPPKARCAECGAYVFGDKVNSADLPICDFCDSRASRQK
jgi:hypothetical protein